MGVWVLATTWSAPSLVGDRWAAPQGDLFYFYKGIRADCAIHVRGEGVKCCRYWKSPLNSCIGEGLKRRFLVPLFRWFRPTRGHLSSFIFRPGRAHVRLWG
ncbi:hypothetical protein FKM82_022795 [Ascaphus truei]